MRRCPAGDDGGAIQQTMSTKPKFKGHHSFANKNVPAGDDWQHEIIAKPTRRKSHAAMDPRWNPLSILCGLD
jgi:hypothetical protein